jgi:hypothetical protein
MLPKDHLFNNKHCYAGPMNDPYSVLNPTRKAVTLDRHIILNLLSAACLWVHCDAVLDSLAKLVRHVELVHTRPALVCFRHFKRL